MHKASREIRGKGQSCAIPSLPETYHMRFHTLIAAISLTLLFSNCQEKEAQKPNIIFLLSDDQRDNTFSATGHPYLKTPNLDRLISQGTRFSNTYIAEPICSPSRVAFFTGMHERINGVGFSSSYQLTEEQWSNSYPELLRQNGYFTGFIGKYGVEYYTFEGNAHEKFDYWWGHDGWTRFFPKEHDSRSTRPYHQAKNDIITPIMGEAFDDFLKSRATDKPFCLSISFNVPHSSQTRSMYTGYEGWQRMSRPANENPNLVGHSIYDTLYRNQEMAIPQETASDPYQWIPKKVMDQSKGRSNTYNFSYSDSTNREHHIRYYQTITGMDKVIGDIITSLDRQELAENTIIIFASDHGLLMGEYGMGGKALLYDLTSKIPCFIYDPRLPNELKGKTMDPLVSSLDITTTILDYAGIKAPANMEGKSLIPLMQGQTENWRQELFLESLFTLRDTPFSEEIRSGDWKYIRMFDGLENYTEADVDFSKKNPEFEQLFNLRDDPEEKNNLIANYEGTELLEGLRAKCVSQSIELNKARALYKQDINVSSR